MLLRKQSSSVICVVHTLKGNSPWRNTKSTKHGPKYCPSNKKKIGEDNFGFDLRPSKEAATEALRLQWSRKKKDDNGLNEKELNIVNNKSEKGDH